jgi:hypothetical protein
MKAIELKELDRRAIAYGLTSLAEVAEPYEHPELYEIGLCAGLVLVRGDQYGLKKYVFIPKEEWDDAIAIANRETKYHGANPTWKCARLTRTYYNDSKDYTMRLHQP